MLPDSRPPPANRGPPYVKAPVSSTSRELVTFIDKVVESGLLSLEAVAQVQAGMQREQRADAKAFAKALVGDGHLTEYQSRELLNGRAKGFVLGNYVILKPLGEGGMGKVFLARHRKLKREVALKVLPPVVAKNAEATRRFAVEAEALARLQHPNIAAAFDAGEHNGVNFLALEYVRGRDLAAELRKKGRLFPADAAVTLAQAAHGLAYAHRRGVVHRDIKPGNLMRTEDGTLKILDMGLARLVQPTPAGESPATGGDFDSPTFLSGCVLGTPDYLSPEQAMGHAVDWRCDLYSLGCTLFHLISGRPPYDAGTIHEKLHAHAMEAVPKLADFAPHAPPRMVALCARLMAKAPDDRPESAEVVAKELEAIARHEKAPPPICKAVPTKIDHRIAEFREKVRSEGASRRTNWSRFGGTVSMIIGGWEAWRPYLSVAMSFAALAALSQRSRAPESPANSFPAAEPTLNNVTIEARLTEALRRLSRDNPWLKRQDLRDATVPFEVAMGPNGLERLCLPGDAIDDLRALIDLPSVRRLELAPREGKRGTIIDLGPLSRIRMRELVLSGNPLLRDLGPLRGILLEELDLAGTGATDLAPLVGMPLKKICLANTPIADLALLSTLSTLRSLDVSGLRFANFSVLADTSIEELRVDTEAIAPTLLRRMPKLRVLNGKKYCQ